jgi:hypothetical protein
MPVSPQHARLMHRAAAVTSDVMLVQMLARELFEPDTLKLPIISLSIMTSPDALVELLGAGLIDFSLPIGPARPGTPLRALTTRAFHEVPCPADPEASRRCAARHGKKLSAKLELIHSCQMSKSRFCLLH